MVEVRVDYANFPKETKHTKTDYFVYLDVEVKGHAEHTGYTNNTKVCAGISACCMGIARLVDESHFKLELRKGYFHCWTDRTINKQNSRWLDKDTVYALNTLVCQLYEIYTNYPNAFKCFELNDVKEKINNDERTKQPSSGNCKQKPFRRRRKRKMGLYSSLQEIGFEEN